MTNEPVKLFKECIKVKTKAELLADIYNENRKQMLIDELDLELMKADSLIVKDNVSFGNLQKQIVIKEKVVKKRKEICQKILKELLKHTDQKIDLDY